jgi:hypothetical protein
MSRCLHGIFLPRNPKFTAADVCSYCKGLKTEIDLADLADSEGTTTIIDGVVWTQSEINDAKMVAIAEEDFEYDS